GDPITASTRVAAIAVWVKSMLRMSMSSARRGFSISAPPRCSYRLPWPPASSFTSPQPTLLSRSMHESDLFSGISNAWCARGGDSGVRGFIAAYDAVTGKLRWHLWTIPAPGEFGSASWPGDSYLHGGATTWMPGTYDPELDTLYWTTSNAAPDFVGDSRPGDNLFTASVLAIDANTGKMKWYFQFTPHDLYDYDANETPVLADVDENGTTRHL